MPLIRRKPARISTVAKPAVQQHPLDVVPIRLEGITTRTREDGIVRLEFVCKPKSSIGSFVARKMGVQYHKQIELDVMGSYFWLALDGEKSLRTIAADMMRKFAWTPSQSHRAVMQFTKSLMLRKVLGLKVEAEHRTTT